MKTEDIRLVTAYGGGIKCEVFIDNVKHLLEIGDIEILIVDAMNNTGYETIIAPRQKYKRILLN